MDYSVPQTQQSLHPRDYQTIICVFGSRHWKDKKTFHRVLTEYLQQFEGPVLFLSGAASSGADDFIIQWCKRFRFPCLLMPADWDANPRAAGFMRNEAMAKILTHGLGFWDGKSRGTKHMIDQCMARSHPVTVVEISLQPA